MNGYVAKRQGEFGDSRWKIPDAIFAVHSTSSLPSRNLASSGSFAVQGAQSWGMDLRVVRLQRGGMLVAKLALIYGMRLLPEEDLGKVGDATVTLKNGKTAHVTMHLIEGSKEEIEKTFHQSIEAFFEMYPEI